MLFAFTENVHAYFDPGTGSLIVQGVIAAVGAILVAGQIYWVRIKTLFVKARGGDDGSGDGWDDQASSAERDHTPSE